MLLYSQLVVILQAGCKCKGDKVVGSRSFEYFLIFLPIFLENLSYSTQKLLKTPNDDVLNNF